MKQYVVDAFADHVFEGNPAAICFPEVWPSVKQMMNITRENNLSHTSFVVREGTDWRMRWFTAAGEINLCGHATLAAAYAIGRFVEPGAEEIHFQTLGGPLTVRREGELLILTGGGRELTLEAAEDGRYLFRSFLPLEEPET